MSALSKNRNIIAFFAAFIYLLCLLSISFSANAEQIEKQSAITYNMTNSYADAKIIIVGINVQCKASLQVYKSCKLTIKMELQKKKSGTYETIKTWSESKTGTVLNMDEKRAINLLSDYRLKTTFTAGSETKVSYAYPN